MGRLVTDKVEPGWWSFGIMLDMFGLYANFGRYRLAYYFPL